MIRLNAMTLSSLDIRAINLILRPGSGEPGNATDGTLGGVFTNARERSECLAKLKRLGVIS